MTDRTTGQRAISLLRQAGFGATAAGPTRGGGSFAEMADIAGREIAVYLDAAGELVNAIPMGEWAREMARDLPIWTNRPYADSVLELETLLTLTGVVK